MVIKTFTVQDMKHLLEDNGHDPDPFIQDHIETFQNHPAAMKVIMDQVNARIKEKESEKQLLSKVEQKVKNYQKQAEKSQIEVNRMRDESNQGQYEDFDSHQYRFNRAYQNQIQFKPSYQEKKKRMFGRIYNRHLQRINMKELIKKNKL